MPMPEKNVVLRQYKRGGFALLVNGVVAGGLIVREVKRVMRERVSPDGWKEVGMGEAVDFVCRLPSNWIKFEGLPEQSPSDAGEGQ